MDEKRSQSEKEKKNNFVRFLGMASMVGINFVATTFVGFAIGWVIDGFFGTEPWFAIIFMFVGIAAGFKYLFKLAKKAGQFDEERDNDREY